MENVLSISIKNNIMGTILAVLLSVSIMTLYTTQLAANDLSKSGQSSSPLLERETTLQDLV